MIIDVSSYQGIIDWTKARKGLDRVILRGTLKNGKLDPQFLRNYRSAQDIALLDAVDIYKFSYATNFDTAFTEAEQCIKTIRDAGVDWDKVGMFWLDLEPHSGVGKQHGVKQCTDIIAAYMLVCRREHVPFGIYLNYNYLLRVLDKRLYFLPIWLARYNSIMGDIKGANVKIWQYSSKGHIDGIAGDVDVNKYIDRTEIC